MRIKSKVVISLSIITILLCGCRGGRKPVTSTSVISTSSNTSITSQSGSSTSYSSATSASNTSSSSATTSSSHSTTSGSDPQPGDYYYGITSSDVGENLRNKLNTINKNVNGGKGPSYVSYDGLKTFAPKCDVNPDDKTKMVGFYDNAELPNYWDNQKTWNREHVWPNSRGGNLVEKDAHMARPCSTNINSSRGSKGYGYESYDPYTDSKITNKVEYYRGVCARIIFYCMIANTNLILEDWVFNYDYGASGKYNPKNTMGTLSDLLEWNLMYSPLDTTFDAKNDLARRVEINRNEVIYSDPEGQGNRNPFVDHPEYACRIWGSTNDKTKKICGM